MASAVTCRRRNRRGFTRGERCSATRSSYLAWEYGRRAPGEPGKTLQVDEAATLEKIDLAMPRAGIVRGRVIDETGEPVAGVNVRILRQEFYRGRRKLVPMTSSARSDDTGHYRAFGFQPGAYLVVAMLRETWVAGGDKKQVFGYAPTFFPSTGTAAEAQRVSLAAGKEASNTDIKSGPSLDGVKIVVTNKFPALTGRITDDKGADAEGIVVLFPTYEARWLGMTDNIRHARTDQTGLFRLATVPPGDYLVAALETQQPWQAADPEFLATLKAGASRITIREGQPSLLTLPLLHRR